jgi:biotin synthase
LLCKVFNGSELCTKRVCCPAVLPAGLDVARCVATARIVMPRTVVRLSAGRLNFSFSDQALCFMAGANSIFDGDKLLTTANNDRNEDLQMFELLGLKSRPAFVNYPSGNDSSKTFVSPEQQAVSSGCGGEAKRAQAVA